MSEVTKNVETEPVAEKQNADENVVEKVGKKKKPNNKKAKQAASE